MNGNTAFVLEELKKHLEGEVISIDTYFTDIKPCTDCRFCYENDSCVINDKMSEYYKLFCECDNVILASPIYFGEITGSILSFFSRFQFFYASKFIRKNNSMVVKEKKGAVIFLGGGDTKDISTALKTSTIVLKQINAEVIDTIYYLNTDKTHVNENQEVIDKIHKLAFNFK